jgi:hypothetical protein
MAAPRVLVVVLTLLLGAVTAQAAEPPSLARARTLYNAADYDGAIGAAAVARRLPAAADAASLVLARAHLERFRRHADPADLASAREALTGVRNAALGPRDQVDLLIGYGQSLFFGDVFGGAAEVFETALSRGALLPARDRLMLLDWWATALDRDAQTRPPEKRGAEFDRIIVRMESELRDDPGSAPANYWLAVAARGAGDVERAWAAAVAGWVRAQLSPETTMSLRADLDRLVTQAIIPERARTRPVRDQQDPAQALRSEWELVKSQWK